GRNFPNYDIYAGRGNWAGVAQWAANGVAICTAAGNQDVPDMVSDLAGGAIVVLTDYRVGVNQADIYAQRVNTSGVVQWAGNGVPICALVGSAQLNPRPAPDGSGGV